MAVLAPLPQQWVNAPTPVASVPALATSAFSGNGVMAPTTTAATSINATNSNGFNNSSSSPYSYGLMTPQAQTQQQSNPVSSILSNGSSIKSAGQFISNGFQLPQSQFINGIGAQLGFNAGTGGATEAISSSLAAADPSLVASGAGAVPESGLLGSSTLSSTLGAAGLGALAGNFLGKIGGNSTGGSIGGAAGAAIGNLIVPGVGGIVGGLIGGIGGGFFGGKKGTATYVEGFKLDDNNTWASTGIGQKNGASVQGPVQQFNSNLTDAFSKAQSYLSAQGLSLKDITIAGGINTKHHQYGLGTSGYLSVGNGANNQIGAYGWESGDQKSQQNAIQQAITAAAKQAGATPDQIKGMFDTIAKQEAPGGDTPLIKAPTGNGNTKWSDFISNYRNSIALPTQQGTTNATTQPTSNPA